MSADDHITPEILLAAQRGEITEDQLLEIFQGHLESLCPVCREAAETIRRHEIPQSAFGPAIDRLRDRLRRDRRLQELAAEARRVPELMATLDSLSPEQRLLRIRNAPSRYANHALAEEMFNRARACLPSDPSGSRGWAETVLAVAAAYSEPEPAHEIRALGFLGNAARALGDYAHARVLLQQAQTQLQRHPVADLHVQAELHSFFGSLCTDQGQADAAEEHLAAALRLYNTLEDRELAARVVMKVSNLHTSRGEIAAALAADRDAIALLEPSEHPRLYIAARLNYAIDLFEAGDHAQARDVLCYDDELIEEHADPHTRLRIRWLEARIAAETGAADLAEETLVEIRDHLAADGQRFSTAIACLDLAALYHRQGRHHDLLATASRAVRLFESDAVHREALGALLLVRDAAAAERLTAATLRHVVAFLETASHDPAARFEPPTS